MTRSRIYFLFPVLFLLFALASQTASAQTLPDKVRNLLDQKYSGWKLHPGDSSCKSQAVVSGDFDGDEKTDYAVMFQHENSIGTVAFLADEKDYKVTRFGGARVAGYGASDVLTVTQKGHIYTAIEIYTGANGMAVKKVPGLKLEADTPTRTLCEGVGKIFYIYSDGRFRQATPVD